MEAMVQQIHLPADIFDTLSCFVCNHACGVCLLPDRVAPETLGKNPLPWHLLWYNGDLLNHWRLFRLRSDGPCKWGRWGKWGGPHFVSFALNKLLFAWVANGGPRWIPQEAPDGFPFWIGRWASSTTPFAASSSPTRTNPHHPP